MSTICGRRTKSCSKCKRRYTKDEYELWACPDCSNDRHCQQTKLYPNGACQVHSGNARVGTASPTFKHGKFSKSLNGAKLLQYEEFRKQRGNETVEAMALLDILISEDAQKLTESKQLWTDAATEMDELIEAINRGDDEEISSIIDRHKQTLNSGQEDAQARENLRKNLDLQTKIAERHISIKVKKKEMVTFEQMTILAAITRDLMTRYIPAQKCETCGSPGRQSFELEFQNNMQSANPNLIM